jgi:hypothetical protein
VLTQDAELVAAFNTASDERALGYLRDAYDSQGGAALVALREALKYATYLDTFDTVVARVNEVAAASDGEVRRDAEALAARAQRRRERAIERRQS